MSADTMRAAIRAALGQAEIVLADADVERIADAAAAPDRAEIVEQVRAAWPAYAPEHGRLGVEVPPVRAGGNTAALIDLAVDTALAAVGAAVDAAALPERVHPFPGNVLIHVQGMGLEGSDEDGPDQADREIRTVTEDLDHAMLLTSDTGREYTWQEYRDGERRQVTHRMHRPVLDLDVPCTLVESSTPGHYHLMIDHTMTWERYSALLVALAEAGLVENGYEAAAARRGHTGVRVPWFRKGDTPPPPPAGAELLPLPGILDDYVAPPWSVA